MENYTPGVCNIDSMGQRKRSVFGLISISLGLIVVVMLAINALSIGYMILAFLFFWAGILGIVQARSKFCIANAAKAQYEIRGKTIHIEDNEAQLLDKSKAQMLHAQAITYAIISTAALTMLVLLLK